MLDLSTIDLMSLWICHILEKKKKKKNYIYINETPQKQKLVIWIKFVKSVWFLLCIL